MLRREVQPFVNVSDDEVKAVIDRLKAAKGTNEYRISEIYLSAAPDKTEQVAARAQQIMDEIKKGGSFPAYASQYSEASTAAVGGDLGWVRPALLPAEMLDVVQTMEMGQIAGPVQVPGGFDIIFLQDKRQVLTADARDALLSLKQVSIDFAPGMTDEQKQQKANELNAAAKELKGCGAVADLAAKLGAPVVDNDGIPARDLPPQLPDHHPRRCKSASPRRSSARSRMACASSSCVAATSQWMPPSPSLKTSRASSRTSASASARAPICAISGATR